MIEGTGNNRIRLTVDAARARREAAMRGVGFDVEYARNLTRRVLNAAPCGYEGRQIAA